MSFACPREIYDGSLHIPVDDASTHFIMWRPGYKDRQYFLDLVHDDGHWHNLQRVNARRVISKSANAGHHLA